MQPPSSQRIVQHDEIRELIPHADAMCLIERVLRWDERSIQCSTHTHLASDNPLRQRGVLRAASAVEYAAQAMALHGALCTASGNRARAGYLVSLRDVDCMVATLDEIRSELWVEVERMMGSGNNVIYAFRVGPASGPLVTGRATVMLDAANLVSQTS